MQRLTKLLLIVCLFAVPLAGIARAKELLPEVTAGDNGLHMQPWFLQSFLDIGDDLEAAKAEGKGLAIFFEQAGCPYCRELHRVNLRDPEIVDLIQSGFHVLQLDLRGAREVTDTDGTQLAERDLARKWGVVFTPTLIFLDKEADPAGKPANQAAAMVMPGYFKPFHFASMFDFVASGEFKATQFQNFINERAARLRAEGKEVTVWD